MWVSIQNASHVGYDLKLPKKVGPRATYGARQVTLRNAGCSDRKPKKCYLDLHRRLLFMNDGEQRARSLLSITIHRDGASKGGGDYQ